jgi:carbohydrate kinase (thermoresistant glucokinase family)
LPWLEAIARQIDRWRAERRHGIVACSALRRRYRDIIIGERPDVRLVYLCGDRTLIADRLAARHGHFMPASLLQSQFKALEEPALEERVSSSGLANRHQRSSKISSWRSELRQLRLTRCRPAFIRPPNCSLSLPSGSRLSRRS